MRKYFCILTLISIWQLASGQIKYGFVDLDKLIKKHPLNSHYDSIFHSYEKISNDSLDSLRLIFNQKIEYCHWGDCPEDYKKKKELELSEFIIKIRSFSDSCELKLREIRNQQRIHIKNQILEEIKELYNNGTYGFIIDKGSILYSEYGSDLSNLDDLTDLILARLKK